MGSAGNIEYVVDTKEVEICSFEIERIHNKISNATLEARESQLILRFTTDGVFAEDNENEMNNLAYRCFSALAYEFGFSIQNLRRGGSTLPKMDGKLSAVINAFGFSWSIEAPRKCLDDNVQHILESSAVVDDYDIQLIHQFVIARSEMDNVSRFMFLYNLALQVNSDNQKQLDESILRIDPSCDTSGSPIGNWNETVYTRLRNQLAHYRCNTNFENTRKEVRGVVNKFQKVVSAMLPRI
ncbi:MAG: hypothetical protein COA46_03020 [Porticoccaceae bacterium]|nr:MAG: hypothetical protein COA46_03020 [Porticoccaceae bacterium]